MGESDRPIPARQMATVTPCFKIPKFAANLRPSRVKMPHPCKVIRPNRTKMFHVKHFCPIHSGRARLAAGPKSLGPPNRHCADRAARPPDHLALRGRAVSDGTGRNMPPTPPPLSAKRRDRRGFPRPFLGKWRTVLLAKQSAY
jgi:hypothetical protein